MSVSLELDEGDRQLVLMALAVLSLEKPGFDMALNNIAVRIDNTVPSEESFTGRRAVMYDRFRELRQKSPRDGVLEGDG